MLISIGIPFYNAVQSLDKCIQSVLTQTIEYWELILADDGSNDGSHEMCEKYAAEDKRIRVISGIHEGVGAARNLIIEHTKGEFLCFMDADDWYEPDYLENLLCQSDSDLVVCGYQVDRYNKNFRFVVSEPHIQPALNIASKKERLKLEDAFASGIMCFVWNKLFRVC